MRWMNHMKTAGFLGLLMGLCLAIGYLAGGMQGLIFGFLIGGVGNLIAFFYSDKIAMTAMGGQEVSPQQAPELHEMVERLAARAGIPKPRVFVCPQDAPNAFATGRNPANAAVAVTEGMVRQFPIHEIEGVIAHEIAHVKHRDTLISTIAAIMAGAITMLAYMLMFFGGRRDNPLGIVGSLAMIILAPLAASLIQAAISRQREFAADSYGGELCGDPNKLAGALVRLQAGNERIPTKTPPTFNGLYIVEPLSASDVASWFASHPPVEKRVAALRQQRAR